MRQVMNKGLAKTQSYGKDLDEEWKELILTAKKYGITTNQIRAYLSKARHKDSELINR
ncbi:anti-repressor SinI family protein [Bacillus niameyensis]|uniref:anti-repressor SinI family protein n=1 Tax=Bacillus niameyensis TaxID=1522308 RepID=UPI001E55BD01|nr:anti-repressor SinI family protein [Bacillus niameyensis]